MNRLIYIIAFLFSISSFAQTKNDTVSIHFDLNDANLNATGRQLIDLLVSKKVITSTSNITLVGYADNLGSENRNTELSEKRAINVQDYLVASGINKELVKLVMGKGAVIRDGDKNKKANPLDRRVDIIMETTTPVAEAPMIKEEAPKPAADPIPLPKILLNQTFVLKNVYFHSNRHTLKDESYAQLDLLVEELRKHPTIRLQIEGHICCISNQNDFENASFHDTRIDATDLDVADESREMNDVTGRHFSRQKLSINRAKTVYDYLIKKGIPSNRINYRGYGNLRPIVKKEQTPEDQALNRRVEIRVIER